MGQVSVMGGDQSHERKAEESREKTEEQQDTSVSAAPDGMDFFVGCILTHGLHLWIPSELIPSDNLPKSNFGVELVAMIEQLNT